MFKKGQLVKTKDYGYYGVVEQISNKVYGCATSVHLTSVSVSGASRTG